MTVSALPVDQRVIDIDSRRFASIEKAMVELVTNCDDSYSRIWEAWGRFSCLPCFQNISPALPPKRKY